MKYGVIKWHMLLDTAAKVSYYGGMMSMMDHLRGRHLDMNLHTVWVDETERVATLPLWTLTGKLAGYQSYRPEASKVQKNDEHGRYYTYRGDKLVVRHNQAVAVWGMESWYLSNTLFVTEGVFNAARFTRRGASAVAVLSNDPSPSTLLWLMMVRQMRPVVAVCDPGSAGAKLRKVGHTSHTVSVPGRPNDDLGDAPESYVDDLLKWYL